MIRGIFSDDSKTEHDGTGLLSITWEVEVGGSKIHGGPRLYVEFKTILDYMKPHHINE